MQKNGEKNENQKTTTIGPLENEGVTIEEGLPTEVPDEKTNVGVLNTDVALSPDKEEPIIKRKRTIEKRKTNLPRKKRPKGIYMDDGKWFDDSSLHSGDDLERSNEDNEEDKNAEDDGKTSELGKFLHFYRPDSDDLKIEVKIKPEESEQASISGQLDEEKTEDENFDATVEEIRALYHEKLGDMNVKKSKKEEKLRKGEGEPCLYRCEHCPKVYPSQGGLSYHRFIYHSAKYTPPVCDICGKTFRIQKYLESHKNTVHFKLKEHLCDLCGKDFSSKYGLKLHKIWHMGTKNFPCDVCGMRFSTIGKVNTHKQVHGGPKNYICEVCSRAFRWKKSLFTHMRTHSGERPYKCEHCDRTFSALWNMQQHVRIHTGERPYKCDVCGKAFALNASMKEHRNRHHKT